jgi:glucose-6-phosphate dehydrogenase assembly protein OpcA
MEDAVSERSAEPLLPSGVKVPFEEIDSALNRNSDDEARRAAGRALTGTIVVAGPPRRLTEAANALTELPDVGLRAVLISYGDNPAPTVHVSRQTVALEGLRPEYLNNAVAALRLSSLPTLVWWRGGRTEALTGLAALSDRLVLDADDPTEVWKSVPMLAERTAVSDLRWTRLTRWRALMAHFFDMPDVCAAASRFRVLRIEGTDRYMAQLYAGWLASTLHWPGDVKPELRDLPGTSPIESVALGDGGQELTLRLADNHSCVETTVRLRGLAPATRTVSLGDQGLAALVGEELRIRAHDLAFERAVAALKGFV